jgi:hypothetical protein
MKLTDGLFLETFYEVAKEYPHLKADDVIVDDLAMVSFFPLFFLFLFFSLSFSNKK